MRHFWISDLRNGSWVKEHGIYLTIYFTTKHGYGSGYDHYDYNADMKFGMVICYTGSLRLGRGEFGTWQAD